MNSTFQLSDDAIAIRQEKASVQALLDAANAQRRILEVRISHGHKGNPR